MVMLVSIPSVAPAVPVRTPAPLLRPRRLLRNVLSMVTKLCDAGVPQLFPYPDLAALPDPEMGIFLNSELTEVGEAMLRQARELSVRVEIDARLCGDQPCALTPESLQDLLDEAVLAGRDTKHKLALTNSQLALLSDVAALAFDALLIALPSDMLNTDLDAETLRTLEMAGIATNGCTDPGGIYRAVCVRLITLERSVMTLVLECLKCDLHVQRLRLLQTAGKFLSAQASRILDEEFEGSDELPRGMHLTEIELAACAASPYADKWPTPYLTSNERIAERERTGALTSGFESMAVGNDGLKLIRRAPPTKVGTRSVNLRIG